MKGINIMKKWLLIIVGFFLIASGFFYIVQKNKKTADSSIEKAVEVKDYKTVLKDVKKYVGYKVKGEGLVEESVYEEGVGVFTTVVLDTSDYSDLILLYEKDRTRIIESRTTILFSGEIAGIYKDNKVFNRAMNLAKVTVDSMELQNASMGNSDVLSELAINKEKQKEKINVELKKLTVYKSSTRIYLKIVNESSNDIYLNPASLKLIADGRKIPAKYEMLDKKFQLDRYLNPTDQTYGALSFNEIVDSTKQLQLKISFSSQAKKEPINFKFKIKLE